MCRSLKTKEIVSFPRATQYLRPYKIGVDCAHGSRGKDGKGDVTYIWGKEEICRTQRVDITCPKGILDKEALSSTWSRLCSETADVEE